MDLYGYCNTYAFLKYPKVHPLNLSVVEDNLHIYVCKIF